MRFNRDGNARRGRDVPIELGEATRTSAVLTLETAEVARLIKAAMMYGVEK